MANQQDGGLRKTLHLHLSQKRGCRMVWTPIETGGVAEGVPDSHCRTQYGDLWIECKKTSGWVVEVRPAQVSWHVEYARLGGKSLFAVHQVGADRDHLWLIRGSCARILCDEGLKGMSEAMVVAKYYAPWNWKGMYIHMSEFAAGNLLPELRATLANA